MEAWMDADAVEPAVGHPGSPVPKTADKPDKPDAVTDNEPTAEQSPLLVYSHAQTHPIMHERARVPAEALGAAGYWWQRAHMVQPSGC